MSTTHSKVLVSVLVASVVMFLAVEIADAGRRGGGGRSMSRGGPAASGSFQRSQARPQRRSQSTRSNRTGIDRNQRSDRNNQQRNDRQDRYDQRQDNRQDRNDQRQDNIDRRQDNIDQRQDFAKEVHDDRKEYYDDRKEWYEDRWRRGAYISVASWNSRGCTYRTVIVGANTYYECQGVRYERVYRGSEVVYIVVN
jgi:hypothetical protein